MVNSRHPSSSLFLNTTLSAIFLKLPQIFWLSSYLYTALVWQRLLSQSVSLGAKKSSQGRTAKLAFRINAFNGILLLVLVPMYVAGCVAFPFLTKLVDLLLMITILGVSGAGIKFGLNLNKELATTSSGKALVPTIKGVIVMGCTGSFSSIFFGFAYIFYLRPSRSKIVQLGFSFVIHQFCEFLIVMALLKTKMDSVKRIKHQEAGFELQSMATSVVEGRDTTASAGSRASRKDLLKSNTSGVSRPMSGKYSASSAKNVRAQSFRTKAITEKESSENESNSEGGTSKNPLNSSPGTSFGGGKSRSGSRISMSKKESAKDMKMQSMEVAFNANAKKTEAGREIGAEEAQI